MRYLKPIRIDFEKNLCFILTTHLSTSLSLRSRSIPRPLRPPGKTQSILIQHRCSPVLFCPAYLDPERMNSIWLNSYLIRMQIVHAYIRRGAVRQITAKTCERMAKWLARLGFQGAATRWLSSLPPGQKKCETRETKFPTFPHHRSPTFPPPMTCHHSLLYA